MGKIQKIGVLTSGGDAPGMNAAIRAITRYANDNGIEVYGVYEGYKGLLDKNVTLLDNRSVSNIIHRGGTILYSARCKEFMEEWAMQKAIDTCKELGIEGLITIGGDGTFGGAYDLSIRGLPCIGVPGTIDNDITMTEYTIGCDTALNTSIRMIDCLRDTCDSHARCSVVEVMGRSTVYLPVQIGLATGASAVLLPGYDYDIAKIAKKMKEQRESGKRNFVIIVSEGLKGVGQQITEFIEKETGIETRYTQLGHVVRGGNPTASDRVMATMMGVAAVKLLIEGKDKCVICLQNGKIVDVPIDYARAVDSYYRGKKTLEHFRKRFDKEHIDKMVEYCKKRKAWLDEFYAVNEQITK